MGIPRTSSGRLRWPRVDTYEHIFHNLRSSRSLQVARQQRKPDNERQFRKQTRGHLLNCKYKLSYPSQASYRSFQFRAFHDYFVTHLPSSSLHPDSGSRGPHHKLPRSASTPHTGDGPSPAAPPHIIGASRELTVVRIPLRKAKHHFGVSFSRGTRPYNEDAFQAGTIEIPAFARRTPVSLSRRPNGGVNNNMGTSADGASGDPQVFYFGVFDGHGGAECSEFLREELHTYIEDAAQKFQLVSSLKQNAKGSQRRDEEEPVEQMKPIPDREHYAEEAEAKIEHAPAASSEDTIALPSKMDKPSTMELERELVNEWKMMVGGYFRRFKPEFFTTSSSSLDDSQSSERPIPPTSIEAVLMYAFLRADLDFISAQAQKPDPSNTEAPLNNDEILGNPSRVHKQNIGGRNRFSGGSTASIALISTPSPMPFWHPASPSSLVVAHIGDTRILLCSTQDGSAVPLTTDHHPSSPIEGSRLRRYAASFVTDSFGEERMSGLANTRAFGDMRSKRIGVSAEPEVHRYELGPAEYSFLVLVSDGVSGTLTDQEIVDIVKEARTPEDGSKDVVSFATEVSKEGDNATCLVVRLGGWERRGEGGGGSLGTKEMRDFKRQEASDPRKRRT